MQALLVKKFCGFTHKTVFKIKNNPIKRFNSRKIIGLIPYFLTPAEKKTIKFQLRN